MRAALTSLVVSVLVPSDAASLDVVSHSASKTCVLVSRCKHNLIIVFMGSSIKPWSLLCTEVVIPNTAVLDTLWMFCQQCFYIISQISNNFKESCCLQCAGHSVSPYWVPALFKTNFMCCRWCWYWAWCLTHFKSVQSAELLSSGKKSRQFDKSYFHKVMLPCLIWAIGSHQGLWKGHLGSLIHPPVCSGTITKSISAVAFSSWVLQNSTSLLTCPRTKSPSWER